MKLVKSNKDRIMELIRYGIIGASVTIINLLLYKVLNIAGFNYKLSNLIAIVISKIYGYFANKIVVFRSHCDSIFELFAEMIRFILVRGFTGVLDYFGLIVLVELFCWDKMASKYIIQIAVIIINFILGKIVVFNRGGKNMQSYNTGNYEKHMSKNPLKRKMVQKFNNKLISDLESILSKFDKQDVVRILDAGSGEGFVDRLLLDAFGEKIKITGIEYTSEAIEIAKEMNPDVKYVQGNIHEIPFEDDSFDIVLCTEVLEHLQMPEKALLEIQRVSKWCAYITVPHEPWFCLGNMLVLKNISRFGNPIDHINHWTKKKWNIFIHKYLGNDCEFGNSFPWLFVIYNKRQKNN